MASRSRFVLTVTAVVAGVIACLFTILCACASEQSISGLPLFTINLSHVGESTKKELDQQIRSIHLKRSPRGITVGATLTPLQRFDVPNAITTALSQGRSKLTSVESNARSHATNILHAGEEQLVKAVNDVYEEVLADLHLGGMHEYYASGFGVIHWFYICSAVLVALAILCSLATTLRLDAPLERPATRQQVWKCVWQVGRGVEVLALSALLLSSVFASAATLGVSSVIDMFGQFTDIECDAGAGFLALTWLAFILQLYTYFVARHVRGQGGEEAQVGPKVG